MTTADPLLITIGCAGGLLPDILRIIKNRHDSELPSYVRMFNFWLGLVALVILGGFAVWVLGATQPREALIIGFTAPEVLSNLAAKNQDSKERGAVDRGAKDADRGSEKFSLRKWWA